MGLLDAASQQQIQQQPGQQPDQQLPPELQQQVDLGVKQATDFILQYDNANALANMADSSDPITAIVETGIPLLNTIYEAAGKAGRELDQRVVASIGFNVAHVMASVLALADVIKQEDVEPLAKQAYQAAIDKHNQGAGQQQPAQQAQQPAQAAPQQPRM